MARLLNQIKFWAKRQITKDKAQKFSFPNQHKSPARLRCHVTNPSELQLKTSAFRSVNLDDLSHGLSPWPPSRLHQASYISTSFRSFPFKPISLWVYLLVQSSSSSSNRFRFRFVFVLISQAFRFLRVFFFFGFDFWKFWDFDIIYWNQILGFWCGFLFLFLGILLSNLSLILKIWLFNSIIC